MIAIGTLQDSQYNSMEFPNSKNFTVVPRKLSFSYSRGKFDFSQMPLAI
jgi:hypothetical protein